MSEEELVKMLDQMVDSEVSRIKVEISDQVAEGEMVRRQHFGRCDVGSPFATGALGNFGENRGC